MVDRPAPERERWLRVVRDDELPPAPPPPDEQPPPLPATPNARSGSAVPVASPQSRSVPPGRAAVPVASPQSRSVPPGRAAAPVASPRSRSRRRPAGRGERVGWVWGGVAAGTALCAGLDRIVGGLDGKPALFLLVIFTLPFWDRLPARLPARLATLAGLLLAVAAAWLAIAPARPEGWWRGEVAFGLTCAIVGTVHALATARRTVEP